MRYSSDHSQQLDRRYGIGNVPGQLWTSHFAGDSADMRVAVADQLRQSPGSDPFAVGLLHYLADDRLGDTRGVVRGKAHKAPSIASIALSTASRYVCGVKYHWDRLVAILARLSSHCSSVKCMSCRSRSGIVTK